MRSGYEAVWVLSMFDLPVKTKRQRRHHTQWRKSLLREGFVRLQFSVYAQHFVSQEASQAVVRRLVRSVPPRGEVRFLTITERQIEKMLVFVGQTRQAPEKPRAQLAFF